MNISVCGIICSECQFFNAQCDSCRNVAGKTFWAADHIKEGICPIYDCSVNKKGLNSCGECDELPCKIFFELKDPSLSDAEHKKSINQRVENLLN